MRCIEIVFSKPISASELQSVITNEGGDWQNLEAIEQGVIEEGVIEEGAACVFIHLYTQEEIDRGFFDCKEMQEILERVGQIPRSVVQLILGHGKGSRRLGRRTAELLLSRWNGAIIDE